MRPPRRPGQRAPLEIAMERRDVNVTELAAMVKRSRTSVSQIRAGKQIPTADTARAIERALDVEHGKLFDYSAVEADADAASVS